MAANDELYKSVRKLIAEVQAFHERFTKEDSLVLFIPDLKNNEIANECLEEAVDHYVAKNYKEALDSFSQCIKEAEPNSFYIHMAYAFRALILFTLEYYDEACLEIYRAKNTNHRLVRLYNISYLLRSEPNGHALNIPEIQPGGPVECANDCVRISKSRKYGKHVLASRDIRAGEIICIEKPFTGIVYEKSNFFCHECLVFCVNTIPCHSCAHVQFCGELCRTVAMEKYHKYECRIFSSIEKLEAISRLHCKLSLRAVLSLRKYFDTPDTSIDDTYRSDRYKEVMNLSIHKGKYSEVERVDFALNGACIFDLVKNYTTFFDKIKNPLKYDLFKGLILKFMYISELNPCYPSSPQTEQDDYNSYRMALYPFTSLYNFSCVPNVSLSYYRNLVEVRATRNIKEGEQLFRIHSGISSTPDNRNMYLYKCHCYIYKKNWIFHNTNDPVLALNNMSETLLFHQENMDKREEMERKFEELIETLQNISRLDKGTLEFLIFQSIFMTYHSTIGSYKDPESGFILRCGRQLQLEEK